MSTPDGSNQSNSSSRPILSAVVVHWRDEEHAAQLVEAWPRDPRLELWVVDNSQSLPELPIPARCLDPGANLGFSGGVNHGVAAAQGDWILILNPDARPCPGALDALLDGLASVDDPTVGGLVPALESESGEGQHAWQLQPLPAASTLVLQTLFLAGSRGPKEPPAEGTAIPQPAAAALVLRRSLLDALGGFDTGFYPAWFEDVDVAHRIAEHGARLLYWPRARFVHAMGGSVPQLGYGPFLWVYYRNLCHYLRRHHGASWTLIARGGLLLGMALRLVALPLRKPRRAQSRRQAAAALLDVMTGALTNWRRPRRHVEAFQSPGAAP